MFEKNIGCFEMCKHVFHYHLIKIVKTERLFIEGGERVAEIECDFVQNLGSMADIEDGFDIRNINEARKLDEVQIKIRLVTIFSVHSPLTTHHVKNCISEYFVNYI